MPASKVLPPRPCRPPGAITRLLRRHGLKIADIDRWEPNEAFASQCRYSRDFLGIDPANYNGYNGYNGYNVYNVYKVNGGSIAIGHPFGMTGAGLLGVY